MPWSRLSPQMGWMDTCFTLFLLTGFAHYYVAHKQQMNRCSLFSVPLVLLGCL